MLCLNHGVDKLFNALLHSNASNLVFEILKHDKIWGGANWISVRPLKILGEGKSSSLPPFCDLRPCTHTVT